jgi:hypothetical protein
MHAGPAKSADMFFSAKTIERDLHCSMDGPITKSDLADFQVLVDKGCKDIYVSSSGGDVETAIKIGRVIRASEMSVIVGRGDKCASACVFLYAAGVRRTPFGPVLIHQPYMTAATQSFAQTQKIYDSLREKVKRYLIDMNVNDSLYEKMMSIPPEKSIPLSLDEMEDLGLGFIDPVHQEYIENKKADRAGYDRKAWLKRKVQTIDRCGALQGVVVPINEVESRKRCWNTLFPEYYQ